MGGFPIHFTGHPNSRGVLSKSGAEMIPFGPYPVKLGIFRKSFEEFIRLRASAGQVARLVL